jgi:hypothetical protein
MITTMTTITATCRRTTIIIDVVHGPSSVMPALVAGIHVFLLASKAWMARASAAMTTERLENTRYKSPGGTKVSCFSVGTLGGHSETF